MSQPSNKALPLSSHQLAIVRELVGASIAQQDLPALESAYRDFRTGMYSLKAAFEQQILLEKETDAKREVNP
ncbi:hypothetical protein [Arthrobacter sp. StoSoilB5]|jgi:hypothetical protein|uniref:hypothetical protein n=1 Tax=Arthrobacter sp. StoSoilB5 TaxID=2830992 RepID=UPI001CC6925E|nr:hypothetical protein [Arthrobacter sp. StoSoilB5]BCW43627.1 hypothetical protein StoSoilB5_08110 [Arthrobacter sp. StoSoilB5]